MNYNKELYTHEQWKEHMTYLDIFGLALSIDEKTEYRVDIFYSGLDKLLRVELYNKKNFHSWLDVIESNNEPEKVLYVDSKDRDSARIVEETLADILVNNAKEKENN